MFNVHIHAFGKPVTESGYEIDLPKHKWLAIGSLRKKVDAVKLASDMPCHAIVSRNGLVLYNNQKRPHDNPHTLDQYQVEYGVISNATANN